ncbi:MAG: hypothetical protein FWG46_02360 [Treponema sp.]|nr:hypothetical protein [Treponema sp.]
MAKKPSAIYEPGELDRVRGKLGNIDEAEAKRMAQILGGEVGMEKGAAGQKPQKSSGQIKRETVELAIPGHRRKRRPGRAVELPGMDDGEGSGGKSLSTDPADDPAIMLKTPYFERVKMDRYASQFEFEMKNSMQVLVSALSFVNEPVDYLNPRFVSRRMNAYYNKIEKLVTSTRGLFPRNNARRTERLKKTSPFVLSILDNIRYWNIERIDGDLAKIQAHPRSAKVSEFAEIIRAIYKPLFILGKLDMDTHIKGAYKLLYKLILVENPMEPKDKNQELVRIALSSLADIRREVHFGLYPLLMKFISDRWFPYDRLFIDRHRRYMSFLGVTENDQIVPVTLSPEQVENGNLEAVKEDIQKEQEKEAAMAEDPDGEDPNDPEVIARKAKAAATEAENRALGHSLSAMETLFPKAGWDRLADYPDMYPYFVKVYGLRRGYELIAPTDPLQQVAVLMHILEDLCVALRYVSFGHITAPDGTHVQVSELIGGTITNWRGYIDDGFMKEYLPRLSEYCRLLEHSTETRTSPFAKRTLNELRWTKRLYFLPYYKFESLGPPPFQKQDIFAIYAEVRGLRKCLTSVAAGIEQGNRKGGMEAKAPCDGINNPWEQYNFEVANPVSKRLDAILGQGRRTNAALVFFALSAATVLDYLVNSESSWAYSERSGVLFRSVDDQGIVPMFGVDTKVDADQIFKDAMKQKEQK